MTASKFATPLVLALILNVVATFSITAMNAFGKLSTQDFPIIDAVFWRAVFGLTLMLTVMLIWRGRIVLRTKRLKSHLLRGIAGHTGLLLIFWAYARMPMADVTALLFTAPVMTVLLSIPVLGEKVGPWRWFAVLAGFAGVLLIAAPGGIGINAAPGGAGMDAMDLAIGLGAALGITVVNLVLRDISRTEDPLLTVTIMFACGTVMLLPFVLWSGNVPKGAVLSALMVTTLFAVIAQITKTYAATMAEASALAPIQYTAIIWAILFGLFLFGDVPTPAVLAGAAIIIAANVLIIWRDHRRKRKPRTLSVPL